MLCALHTVMRSCVCVHGCLCTVRAMIESWQEGTPTPFSSTLPFTLPAISYSQAPFRRILEYRDLATHWDSVGRVHLRPLPPKWAHGRWLQMRSAPSNSLILHGTLQAFTEAVYCYSEGADIWVQPYNPQKHWQGDARWDSMPVALCDGAG